MKWLFIIVYLCSLGESRGEFWTLCWGIHFLGHYVSNYYICYYIKQCFIIVYLWKAMYRANHLFLNFVCGPHVLPFRLGSYCDGQELIMHSSLMKTSQEFNLQCIPTKFKFLNLTSKLKKTNLICEKTQSKERISQRKWEEAIHGCKKIK